MGQVKFRVESGIKSEGNLLPDDNNNEYYIGSSDLKWKGIYLGTDGVIFNNGSVQTEAFNASSATLTAPVFVSPEERMTVSSTAATGTINFDADTQGVLYYTSNASGDWTLNVRGSGSTTIDSKLSIGDSITISFLVTNGSTAYKHSALTIDGSAQTVKWSGGTAPAAGNASSVDAYSFTIIKTASATYTVLGAGPIKYA